MVRLARPEGRLGQHQAERFVEQLVQFYCDIPEVRQLHQELVLELPLLETGDVEKNDEE